MNTEIEARLERIERILLTTTPWKKLPPDLRKRAVELQEIAVPRPRGDLSRLEVLCGEFEKLAALPAGKRDKLHFPRELMPHIELDDDDQPVSRPHAIVPLSILINRCENRKGFEPVPGEMEKRENIMETLAASNLVLATLHECGLRKDSDLRVVMSNDMARKLGVKCKEPHEEPVRELLDPVRLEKKHPRVVFSL